MPDILLGGRFMSFFIGLGFLNQKFWTESKSRIVECLLVVLYPGVEIDISLEC